MRHARFREIAKFALGALGFTVLQSVLRWTFAKPAEPDMFVLLSVGLAAWVVVATQVRVAKLILIYVSLAILAGLGGVAVHSASVHTPGWMTLLHLASWGILLGAAAGYIRCSVGRETR